MYYIFSICQSIGSTPLAFKNSLHWLKCLHPKKPLYADNGLGCGALRIRCFGLLSIDAFLCAGGAGEILLTSMDCDGTKAGYDIELTNTIASNVSIPVIASGGAGSKEHFLDAFTKGKADAALAASLFHYKELDIMELKKYLADNGIPMRM